MDRKTIALIFTPFASFIMAFSITYFIRFEPELTPGEKEHLTFTPENIKITERQPVIVEVDLKNPIEIPGVNSIKKLHQAQADAAASMPPVVSKKRVSFILISTGKKIAIINGFALKEGDNLDGTTIVRIESDRVLAREGRGEIWLRME